MTMVVVGLSRKNEFDGVGYIKLIQNKIYIT